MRYLLLALLSSAAQAADFGPAPLYTSNDPAYTITAAVANTSTGSLRLDVNGASYNGHVTYVLDYSSGGKTYFHSLPTVLVSNTGGTVTAAVNVAYYLTGSGSGRGGTRKVHYDVVGGNVT